MKPYYIVLIILVLKINIIANDYTSIYSKSPEGLENHFATYKIILKGKNVALFACFDN